MKVDKSSDEAQPYRLAPHGPAPHKKQLFCRITKTQNTKQKMEHS